MQPQISHHNTANSSLSAFLQSEAAIGQMKSSLVLFGAIGVGLGIVGSTLSGSVGALGQNITMATIIPIALVTPIVGIIPGRQIGNQQTDAQPLAVYALVAIAAGMGAVVQFMIASVLTAVEASGTSVPDLFVFSFVVALGTIIAGLGSAFAVRN
ncbi:hypothetical protein [Halocatena pleomorpha]|uniref:Uncharacterized protein n=1 Tax=Halocatena pleomorpha TaxID=1785090 RepID=A0A3P3RFS6_9EURY|nr:hypothetical protein [Halocatena pleomorpha]RRJ31283.1 hypothetical protein EIK79_07750 [Halocatena pleomorpha]